MGLLYRYGCMSTELQRLVHVVSTPNLPSARSMLRCTRHNAANSSQTDVRLLNLRLELATPLEAKAAPVLRHCNNRNSLVDQFPDPSPERSSTAAVPGPRVVLKVGAELMQRQHTHEGRGQQQPKLGEKLAATMTLQPNYEHIIWYVLHTADYSKAYLVYWDLLSPHYDVCTATLTS